MKSYTLTIEKTVYGGMGLGFAEGHTFFVPYTLPGEIVTVRRVSSKKRTIFGSVDTILQPSPERITPLCPIYGMCGGCDFQHCNYQTELDEKRSHITELLQRTGGMSALPPIKTVSAERYGYRSIAGIKYSSRGYGFFRRKSHQVIPFPAEGCRLLRKELVFALSATPLPSREFRMSLDSRDHTVIEDKAPVDEYAGGYYYTRANSSFFQTNSLLREAMIGEVLAFIRDRHYDLVIDGGCGCGFFTLPLAGHAKRVEAFDTDRASLEYARQNAERNGIDNISFADCSFEKARVQKADLCVVDPPRSGLSSSFISRLTGARIPEIIYISCDTATWARDLSRLKEHYTLEGITFMDMFPATSHIEVISFLKRI